MVANINDVQRLRDTVQALGAELPQSLAKTAELASAIASRSEVSRAPNLEGLLSDPDLTAAEIEGFISDVGTASAREYHSSRPREIAVHTLVQQFTEDLRGAGGDALMDTLRPKFEEAAGAFAEAGRRLDGGASAESILASGEPEQIEAWRALPQAQAKADSIRGLVRLMVVHFGVVRTTEYTEDHAQAAFFSASSDQLIQAGHAFGGTHHGLRGGVWAKVPMRVLNTVTEARAIMADAESGPLEPARKPTERELGSLPHR
ncbi:hypothetical protein ATN38_05800 [Rhodococcus sp. FH8]|uniref:hypothetical protein n=1 Tax=Rhodococcus TaxID=1827 RepID=UPI001ABF1F29|nr:MULTISPECIES: hypothetical protein [Rhodococcus]MBW0286194.1 hypothetical protein [Rhodococcus sp. FH8]